MAEVTNEYAIGGNYNPGFGVGLTGVQNSLISAFGNAGEHRQTNAIAFQTDRDVLSTSAQTRVEAQQNKSEILVAINNSNLLNAERESRFLRDALAAQTLSAQQLQQQAFLIAQIGGMMNTAISSITNAVSNTNTSSVSIG